MQRLGVSQKIKLSNNTHTRTLFEYIQMLKTSCLGLQTTISSQKRKHCILCWKALHSLHQNVHNVSGCTWAGNSQGNSLSVSPLILYYRWKCWKLQNLVNAYAYAFYCYLFLIADFASFWMLQNYFMLALLLIFNCRLYAYFWMNIIFSCMHAVPRFVSHQHFRGVAFGEKFYLSWNTSNTYV